MLIENISGYGWKRAEIPALTVTGVTPCDFGNPALLYRFDGEGSVKISADEVTLIYDGQLPYVPQEPIACDSLIFEAAGEEPVTVSFLGMLADVLTIPAQYRNTSSGMTSVAGNVDDSVYTVAAGFSGFRFGGVNVSSVYVSTNHFVGFGSNAEHLKIFRRDGRSTAIYRQTVTLDQFSFLKIRFEGYTVYSNQITANRLIYELFLLSTGDMFLHVIQAPTSSGTYGASSLTCGGDTATLEIPANGTTGTMVSFYREDTDGNDWDIQYADYQGNAKDRPLYLLQGEDGKYYAAASGALAERAVTAPLTAISFLEYGGEELPSGALLPPNPKIYAWAPVRTAKLRWRATAHPLPQELTCTVDMSDESIKGISLLSAEYSGIVYLSHKTDGGWSDPLSLGNWVAQNCEALYGSLGEDKLLHLKFQLYSSAEFSRFKITFIN